MDERKFVITEQRRLDGISNISYKGMNTIPSLLKG